jgi:hypothetical protein
MVHQQEIHSFATLVRRSAVWRRRLPEFCRINIGITARQQHSLTARDQPVHLGESLIERNPDGHSPRKFDGSFVLWNCTLAVLAIA